MPSLKKQPSRAHENEAGYRFCGSCQVWKPASCFAATRLSHDGYHPMCLLHAGCSQAQSDRSDVVLAEMLRKARIHKDTPIVCRVDSLHI